ncbi:MAG: RnfH family protein [Candidatus Berkiella sp.]
MQKLTIEVVFAKSEYQHVVSLSVPVGTTILQAIELSGLLAANPEIDLAAVGIFGEKKTLNEVVKDNDRVEIYRPLHQDPMQARKQRAVTQKRKKFKPLRAKDLV